MDDESNGTSQIFGVEVDGKIVAWMTVEKESWNNRLRIHELLVLEEYRGKGIGKISSKKPSKLHKN
jgi:GNAT superfamily N-acetyltransferase